MELTFDTNTFYLFPAVRLVKRAKANTIVLTGLSGSGKTVLFYQVSIDNTYSVTGKVI